MVLCRLRFTEDGKDEYFELGPEGWKSEVMPNTAEYVNQFYGLDSVGGGEGFAPVVLCDRVADLLGMTIEYVAPVPAHPGDGIDY